MKLLNEGGLLATFSCSSAISPELFKKILASSAEDARLDFSILDNFSADQDHPQLLSFPEGEYLKGLLLQKRSWSSKQTIEIAPLIFHFAKR